MVIEVYLNSYINHSYEVERTQVVCLLQVSRTMYTGDTL